MLEINSQTFMRKNIRSFEGLTKNWLLFLAFAVYIWSPSIAMSGPPNSDPDNSRYIIDREADMIKLISFLENKMGDQKLLEKAKDKLSKMSDRQFRLMVSLSDRTDNEWDTAGAEIAFLLITALIVFS